VASVRRCRPLLGTYVVVRAEDPRRSAAVLHTLVDEAFARLARVHALMSFHDPASELSRLNADAHRSPQAVDPWTRHVIGEAVRLGRASGGAFDPAVAPALVRFGFLPPRLGSDGACDTGGWRDIQIHADGRVSFTRPLQLDLGGIAKGFAVDRATKLLWDAGFVDFILQAGGDMYVSGKKGARPWVVGIRDPRGAREDTFAIAPIENHSFSTSGDYERFVLQDGVRYHHILDPRTGRPAMATRSVTVMAKDAFTADAWSKVLFILGADKAMPLVEKLDDFEAAFVTADNQVVVSSGLDKKLQILEPPTDGP
jgi:thiamine biosynthesis lipoprotein